MAVIRSVVTILGIVLAASRALAGGVETDGSTPTTLDTAPNGVPVVNIANPNAQGLSHNSYTRFNVDPSGLILNNADRTVVDTQLGGQIFGNPNLAQPARVILNEVTSTHPSLLQGFTEVAGQGADVVIANPNGISVNGAGFLNTPRVTLTTGSPEFDALGGLSGFDVRGGTVTIDGGGLNNLEADATSIYSLYLRLNAKLHARDLDIALGANQVDYPGRKVVRRHAGTAQQVLLDASALGGMYAGKIRLVGTAAGLGVNLPPEVVASSGEIEVTADGRVVLQQLDAAGDIRVASAGSIESTDSVYARGEVELAAGDAIEIVDGMVAADDAVRLEAERVDNAASVIAGLEADGTLNKLGAMAVDAVALTNRDTLLATHSIDIDAGDVVNEGLLSSGYDLTVSASNLTNEATLFAGDGLQLLVRDRLHNDAHASILAAHDLLLAGDIGGGRSGEIVNDLGSVQTLYGDISIHADRFENLGFARLDYDLVYHDLGHDRQVDDLAAAMTIDLEYSTRYTKHKSKARQRWVNEILSRLRRQAPALYADNVAAIYSRNARFRAIETRLVDYSITEPALLDSGGELALHVGDFLNHNAIVAAAGDLHFDIAGSYRNQAERATEQLSYYDYYVRAKHRRNWKSDDKYSSIGRAGYIPGSRSVTVGADAVTQAGGNVSGQIGGSANVAGALAGSHTTKGFDAAAFGAASLKLPRGDFGLFVRSADPDSQVLVETNPRFTDFGSFIGSSYLLDRLDVAPLQTLKRLGDAFYESKLVRDSIFAQTGRRYLDPALASDNAQFRYLMDNALATRDDLELTPGVALSAAQVNALTADIVWLVETEVDGQRVLVPRVYLAHDRGGELRGGRLVAGGDLDLQVASLDNSGLIEAAGNLRIGTGGAIENRGAVRAGGDAALDAAGSIDNVSGRVRGDNVSLTSRDGDIVNRRSRETFHHQDRDVDLSVDLVGDAGRIEAKQSLELQAGGDIVVSGSQLTGGSVALEAERVAIEAEAVDESFRSGGEDNYFAERSRRHYAATVNGGDIVIFSNGETRVSGSRLEAADELRIEAGDIEIAAVEDSEYRASQDMLEGVLSERVSSRRELRSRNRGGKLNATTVVLVTDQGDIELSGSEIEAGMRLAMTSAGDIRVEAGHDGSLDERHEVERGFFSGGNFYRETEDLEGRMTRSAVLSRVRAGSVDLDAAGAIELNGVDVEVAERFDADARDISIRNAEDTETTWSKHTEISIGFDDLAENFADLDDLIEVDDGKLSLRIAEASYEHAERVETETRVVESRIAAGDIGLGAGRGEVAARDESAGGDILIQGSELSAAGGIELGASGQVALLDAQDTRHSENLEQSGSATLSLNLQNEYDQLARAIKAVKAAERDLRRAEASYAEYKDTLDAQEREYRALERAWERGEGFIEQADLDAFARRLERLRADDDYYQADIALAATTLASKTTALVRQGGKAAASSTSGGFNLSLGLDIEAFERELEAWYRQSRASTLAASTIDIDAGQTARVRGSNLVAQERIDIDAAAIDIRAGVSSSASDSNSRRIEGGYTWDLLGSASSFEDRELGSNHGADGSNTRGESLQFHNAQLSAGTVRLGAEGGFTAHGADVHAGESLVIEAGDLDVASVQNIDVSTTRSLGGSFSGVGGGLNASDADRESVRTVVTALTGETVDIRVDRHSEIRGAVIAATDEDGRDNGQLTFSTDTLSAGSLINTAEDENRALGLLGGETSTLDYADETAYNRTKSLATLGSGNVTIGDIEASDTRFLNTDLENTEVSIYDLESNRNLSGELDTRLLTEGGRYQIAEDWLKTGIIANTIEQIVTTERVGIEDFFTETGRYHTAYEAVKAQIREDRALAAMLQDPALSPGQKEAMLNQLVGAVAQALEFEGPNNVLIATDEKTPDGYDFSGFYSTETGQAYINDVNNDSTRDLIVTAGHESIHAMDQQGGIDITSPEYGADDNAYATNFGLNLADYADFALGYHGHDGLAMSNDHVGNDSEHVRANSLEFAGLDKAQGDFYCVNAYSCYGSETEAELRQARIKPTPVLTLSNYQVRERVNAESEVIAYEAYNASTENIIVMLPEELNSFVSVVEPIPWVGYSLENMTIAEHTAVNAQAGLHDDMFWGGIRDAWQSNLNDPNTYIEFTAGIASGGLLSKAFRPTGRGVVDIRVGNNRLRQESDSYSITHGLNQKPIIIGENMRRVNEYAVRVDGHAYRPWKYSPFDFDLSMKRNERWIRDQVRDRRTIIDIGPDFQRRAATGKSSDFYEMERRVSDGYENYNKAFLRRGSTGGVPGLDF